MRELRAVCHGCRQVSAYRDDNGDLRPMVLPGTGSVWVERAPDTMVEQDCPICGDSEDPGWLPGFVPPT